MKTSRQSIPHTISALLLALILGACGGESPESLVSSSKEFLAKKDTKAAVIQLKNALQKNPNLAEARFLLGSALLESGDLAGAELELRKALELKHPADAVVPQLARAMLGLGQAKKMVEEFGGLVLSSREAQAPLKTSLSAAYAALGKEEDARRALAEALEANPEYEPARLADIRETIAQQDIPGAKAKIDTVLTKNPKSAEAIFMRGTLLAIEGNTSGALEQYQKSIEAKPSFQPAHTAIIFSLLQSDKIEDSVKQLDALKKIAPKTPQTYFLDAQVNYQRKEYKAARESAQQLLRLSPNNPNSLQLAGAIEYQLGSYLQAETYLTKAVQSSPKLLLARRMLVANYLRAGQPTKAIDTLQPILGEIDKDSAFLTLAGQAYLQNGDAGKAAEYFTKASKLDPENASKKTSVAVAHLAQGNTESGFQELQRISAEDKGITADLALITAHLKNNQLDKALQAIDVLEKKQPDNPATYNLRARALLAKKDVTGARKSFEKAIAINPTFFPAVASLATLDLADKKPQDAKKRFETVLTADPKNIQALLALAELNAANNGNTDEIAALLGKAVTAAPTDIAPRVALIQHHLKNNDTKKALTAANDALAAMPDKPEILEALGRVQQISGDLNQASISFGKMAALQPASPIPLVRLAEVQIANKSRDDGIKTLKKALEIKPDLLEAQRALIQAALENKNTSEALGIAKTVQKQRPKEAAGYLLEGGILSANQRQTQAIEIYRTGLKASQSPDLAIRLHSALASSGNKVEAEKHAAAWLKENPKDVGFRMYMGDLASAANSHGQAAAYYQSALALQPNNALILNNLAWSSGQIKSPKALEYAEKANELAPNQPAIMDTLAVLTAEKGNTGKAIELLRKAISLAPQAASIQLNLAKTLIKAGNKDDARKELEALAKLGDKFPGQAEVSQLLKTL
jgi:putative PEP-CTERM system TPR-repeat lipoprotein